MRFYITRLLGLLAVAAAIWGFLEFQESREADSIAEMSRYSELVARLGVVDALMYPPSSALDSAQEELFAEYEISDEQLQDYLRSFNGHEEGLALFWSKTKELTDSLVDLEMIKLRPPEDSSSVDSVISEEPEPDSSEVTAIPRVTRP